MPNLPPTLTSRSAYETFLTCPRLRYWAYEWGRGLPDPQGNPHCGGLSPARNSVYLETGTAVHAGLSQLLQGSDIEIAIAQALQGFWSSIGVNADRLDPEDDFQSDPSASANSDLIPTNGEISLVGEDSQEMAQRKTRWIANEQAALVEGLLRGWHHYALPKLQQQYEVLEVEKDRRFGLTEGVIFASRPDALLRDRENGQVYAASWKTANSADQRKIEAFSIDTQGLTEILGLQLGDSPVDENLIWGSQLHLLVKGRRDRDERLGLKVTYSPLLRGWVRVKPGISGDEKDWAWSFKVPSDRAESGVGRLDYRTWKPFYSWIDYPGGVREWFKALVSGRVQPECAARWGNPVEQMFVDPPPLVRAGVERQLESTLRQIEEVEDRVREASVELANVTDTTAAFHILDRVFPQNRKSCITWRKCSYFEMCHGTGIAVQYPLESGFRLRKDHHELPEEAG